MQLFQRKMLSSPIGGMFRSRRSIRCNPIIDICIVEPAFDVYICCRVCEMDLLTVRSFSARRWMSSVKAGLKSDISRYDIVKYTRTRAKLCPSYVKNALFRRKLERKPTRNRIILFLFSPCGALKHVLERQIYFRNGKNSANSARTTEFVSKINFIWLNFQTRAVVIQTFLFIDSNLWDK